MFRPVVRHYDFPAAEKDILSFWREHEIFEKSLHIRDGSPDFVFYEGPPTANGKPHAGHVLTRIVKDIFCRYRTMTGWRVMRKAGWDTHGLPVEIEVEKALGLKSKGEVESYGVEKFVLKCIESVFRYTREWEELTERIGFWLDMSEAYVTYHAEYVESVWWALSELWRRKLLYRGHKVVPWCPRCGTALSSHEVGLGYEEVEDPSIFVGFRIREAAGREFVDEKTFLLAWTTTPWTLVSNAALAVRPEVEYAVVRLGEEKLVMASKLVETVMREMPHEVVARLPGSDLVGLEYAPLYEFGPRPEEKLWTVIPAKFVTLDTGTGIVHIAPAFGADDHAAGKANNLAFIQHVDEAGNFRPEVEPWAGRSVRQCDKEIIADLKARKLLLRAETVRHEYPFCWRCHAPLLYFARDSWVIRTTECVEKMLENNRAVGWHPEAVGKGRFGKFLESNVDWALSRDRYWGTPLPIWICESESCRAEEAVASRREIEEKNPDAFKSFDGQPHADIEVARHLALHKPYIDEVTLPCPKCGSTMRRVPEVVDCWFDSGCMPFAQWGHPHHGSERFRNAFPADLISEAVDQTRGWFYSMLAISTLLFDREELPHPYRHCVVLGHVCDEKGKKYSKHLDNYVPPEAMLDRLGADALRWFFSAGVPVSSNVNFSEDAVRNAQKEFVVKLWEVYRFFVIYAGIDGFDPSEGNRDAWGVEHGHFAASSGRRPVRERSLLDRWIVSELALTAREMRRLMDGYDLFQAARRLYGLIDSLSNWYVRRSRDRFWAAGETQEKFDAHWTLYETLLGAARLAAPFVPFVSEQIYQNLARAPWPDTVPESVHLVDFPRAEEEFIDEKLSSRMAAVREIVSLGRAARAAEKIRVRQPLAEAIVITTEPGAKREFSQFVDLIVEELNVKKVSFARAATRYVSYEIKPKLAELGPKFGPALPEIRDALRKAKPDGVRRTLEKKGKFTLLLRGGRTVSLTSAEVEVVPRAKAGYAATSGPRAVVVLRTKLTGALRAEGIAREIISRVQSMRKELNLEYQDRIEVSATGGKAVSAALKKHRRYICKETLAAAVGAKKLKDAALEKTVKIEGEETLLAVKKKSP